MALLHALETAPALAGLSYHWIGGPCGSGLPLEWGFQWWLLSEGQGKGRDPVGMVPDWVVFKTSWDGRRLNRPWPVACLGSPEGDVHETLSVYGSSLQ